MTYVHIGNSHIAKFLYFSDTSTDMLQKLFAHGHGTGYSDYDYAE